MSKVVRVQDGDYKIIVGSVITPGDIILDTNPTGDLGAQGKVIVTGDLEVRGNTIVVQTETLTIKDNIIEINKGETGEGVSTIGPTAGIRIDRGTEPDVSILWDENLESRYPTLGLDLPGTFKFIDNNGDLMPIATNSINTFGSDLSLISSGTGVITVSGTTDYEQRILDYNTLGVVYEIKSVKRLANVAEIELTSVHSFESGARVDIVCFFDASFSVVNISATVVNDSTISYPNSGPNLEITELEAGLGGTVRPTTLFDDDYIPNMRAVADYTKSEITSFVGKRVQEGDTRVQTNDSDTTGVSEITLTVDGIQRAFVNNNGLYVDSVNVFGSGISNYLTDNLQINSVLNIQNKLTDPDPDPGYVKLYSKTNPGSGDTGLYFVNTLGNNDELISKTKALLFSLIL